MTSKEFEAYRNEVARLESEMRQSKERETKECRTIRHESEHESFLLKEAQRKANEEFTRKKYELLNACSDKVADVKNREKSVRWNLQTQLSKVQHEFRNSLPMYEAPAQEGGAS